MLIQEPDTDDEVVQEALEVGKQQCQNRRRSLEKEKWESQEYRKV